MSLGLLERLTTDPAAFQPKLTCVMMCKHMDDGISVWSQRSTKQNSGCNGKLFLLQVSCPQLGSETSFLGDCWSRQSGLNIFALLQCLFRALRLQDPHVIFEVDSLILAKQLARHLPWASCSENLIAIHQQCVHVCDSLSALHIS